MENNILEPPTLPQKHKTKINKNTKGEILF